MVSIFCGEDKMIRKTKEFDAFKGEKVYLVSDESDIVARLYPVLKDKGVNVVGVIPFSIKHVLFDTPENYCGLTKLSLSNYDGSSKLIVCTLEGNRRKVISELLNHDIYNFVMLHASYTKILSGSIPRGVVSYFKDTNYFAYSNEECELYRAFISSKKNPGEFKVRFDFNEFPYFQKYNEIDLKTDDLQKKYEETWGKYKEITPLQETEESKKKFEEECTVYSIRSHFDTVSLNDNGPSYVTPLQAGAALTDIKMCDLQDNTGDNISNRNPDFSECSAIYWAWKNSDHKKYIGVCHYRRFLAANTAEIVNGFEHGVDVINVAPTIMYPTIKKHFSRNYFFEKDYNLMQEAIKKNFPDYELAEKELGDGFFYLACNICIMKREWFDKMCEFIFGVLLYVDDYYRDHGLVRGDRYAGYYFEYLYSVFIMKHAKELNIEYSNLDFLSSAQAKEAYYANITYSPIGLKKVKAYQRTFPQRIYDCVCDNGISYALIYLLRKIVKGALHKGKPNEDPYVKKDELDDNFDFPSINDD